MRVEKTKKGSVCVLSPKGKLASANSALFADQCMSILHKGETVLLMECSGLDYISSAGLRSIYLVAAKLETVSGKIAFCSLTKNVKKVFDLVDMGSGIPIFGSEKEAIKHLQEEKMG